MVFVSQPNRFALWQILAGVALAVGAIFIALSFPRTKYNHLLAAQSGRPPRPVTWLWLDALDVSGEGETVTLNGYLWNASAGNHRFDVTSDGGVTIRFEDAIVYARPAKGGLITESFSVEAPSGAVPITIEYQAAAPLPPRVEFNLREGSELIAPWRLYPTAPEPGQVSQQWWAWHGLWAGLWLVAAGFLVGVGVATHSLAATRRDWVAIAGIAAVATALRLAVAYERYQTVPDFYAMESIWDNFVLLARSLLTGNYQLAGSYYQQGAIVYMALAQIAVGPGLWPLYVFNAALGGLSCVLVLLAGWAFFGRGAGLLAGTLMALYAPLIHYQTTLQIVVPATLAGSLAVACAAWLVRRPGWGAAVACGIAAALGALSRSTLIATSLGGPLAALFAVGNLSFARRLSLGAVALLSFGLAVLPMTLANASVGVYSVSSGGFTTAFFRGNHRDTAGVNEYFTDREVLARLRSGDEINFNAETLRDIRADPAHWVKFLIHKAGMFWSGHEYSDRMIDFYTTGLAPSLVLRGLWVGGGYSLTTVVALALIGAALLWRDRAARPAIVVLGSITLAFMALTILFPVTGRVRTPIHPAFFPLAAAGIIALANGAKQWRSSWPRLATASAAAVAAVALAHYCETRLPGPTTVAPDRLPATLIRTDVDFDSKVRLIGFDAFDSNFRSGGYLDITFYWQALRPLDADYTAYVHLLDPTLTRVGGADRVLGAANFPVYPSSQWKPGEIVRQSYFIPLPKFEGAVPLRIIVGLRRNDDRLPVTNGSVEILDGTAAIITGVSVLPEQTTQTLEPARHLNLSIGSELSLIGANLSEIHEQPQNAASINVSLDWHAHAHPTYRYHLFLHLLDSSGTLVAQFDGPPDPEFPTDTWAPNSDWHGQYQIALPQPLAPGDYQLVAGLYRLGTLERLPIAGPDSLMLPDNRFLLSMIRVKP